MHRRFIEHNLFWNSLDEFLDLDRHLSDLKKYKYQHKPSWWKNFQEPAVHLLFGPRQLGKTTSIKLYMKDLLVLEQVEPGQIFYLACDGLLDRQELEANLRSFMQSTNRKICSYIFLDEANAIPKWEVCLKALIDEGLFVNSILLVSGSDSIILEDGMQSFPGIERRGRSAQNIKLSPLSFAELVKLVEPALDFSLKNEEERKMASSLLTSYLQCGGFLGAINELFTTGDISPALIAVYKQWILGDFLRKGKDKKKLIDLFSVLLPRLSTPLSYSRIAQAGTQISTDAVIDYSTHLERLGVLITLQAFNQNSLSAHAKKDKKFHLSDPFLYKVIAGILEDAQLLAKNSKLLSEGVLIEGIVASTFARSLPCFYLKAEGEIDLIVLKEGSFTPIEVKWSEKLEPSELKQILKMEKGYVLSKLENQGRTGKHSQILLRPVLDSLLDPKSLVG